MYNINKLRMNSDISGLKYIPSFENNEYNNQDYIVFPEWSGPERIEPETEFSVCNREILKEVILQLNPKSILEIGVNRSPLETSSTGVILDNKSNDCIYIGVDIKDKTHLNNVDKNIYTMRINSSDHDLVYEKMKMIGILKFDLILIDGYHSINQLLSDWKYTDKLSKEGIVILHDTNFHPGPVTVFDAIDENLYDKKKYCTENNDNGIAIIQKRQ